MFFSSRSKLFMVLSGVGFCLFAFLRVGTILYFCDRVVQYCMIFYDLLFVSRLKI